MLYYIILYYILFQNSKFKMNSWKKRIQEYNQENDVVTLPFQSGGNIQNQSRNSNTPSLESDYFKNITLNGNDYPLHEKKTMQILKRIINYYNKNMNKYE